MRMDRSNDRITKFIQDVQNKKIIVGKKVRNKNQAKSDVVYTSTSACHFCPKIFVDSSFLKKHIIRRHLGDLTVIHKSEFSTLANKLEEGFIMLREEIIMHKQGTESNDLKVAVQEKEQENTIQNQSHMSEENENIHQIDSNELKDIKDKVNSMEVNIQGFENKLEELNNVLRNEVLKKQDIEDFLTFNNEKILRIQESKFVELRQILTKELQTIFSGQLHEQNSNWKLQMTELKHDIKKLDWIIDDIKNQLYSPDYINVLKEKLEHEILHFLNSSKRKNRREKIVKTKSKISETKYTSPKEKKMAQRDKLVKRAVSSVKYKSLASSPKELASLLDEKLSNLNIKPNTSKISSAEFRDKLRLIDSEKEYLNMKYFNFSEVYNKITMEVDQKVHLKQVNKKSKKIRFSDPIVLSKNGLHDAVSSDEDYHNKTLPFVLSKPCHATAVKSRSFSSYKSEGFSASNLKSVPRSEEFNFDIEGSGDFLKNSHKSQNHHIEEVFETTSVASPSEFKTSSPIKDIQVSEKEFYAEASTSSKICSEVEKSDGKITPSGSHKKNNENSTENSIKKLDEPKNSVIDDFDESSLQTLSSWEDEKLHSDN